MNFELLWNRWIAGAELVTCAGQIAIRFYKCMIVGAARPQVIVVVDSSDASEVVARKVITALKKDLNHFGKFLTDISFDELKSGEVALLTNIHSANEACAFVDRVKSASI